MEKLLIIGGYNGNYQRNKVLISAFNNVFKTQEINVGHTGVKRYFSFLKNIIQYGREKDYILLMHPAHKFAFVLLIFKLFSKKKIVLDAFTSIYDSFIYDRRLAGKYSIKALYYYTLDYLLCKFSDIIFFDTEEHKKYFIKKFKIKQRKKKIILPVSLDIAYYHRIKPSEDYKIFPKNKFNILFYGYYIPLQGVEYIVRTAKVLEKEKDIEFILIGSGQTRKKIDNLYKNLKLGNIKFINRIPFKNLIEHIKSADLCLGIFGETEKAKRVIPNKILDYAICGKNIITGRSRAVENFFKDNKEIIYCDMADEKDLANKILYVKNNRERVRIGLNARKVVEEKFSSKNLENIIKNNF